MEKTPRYTSNEKRLLLKLIYNQRDIIEKKKTDSFTNRAKENAWSIITKSYNQCVKFKRTTKQLRQLYKNMKYAANVNSTSTTNLSEMLEILNMQILSDPNVRIGENFSIKQTNPTDLSQSSSTSQQQQQLQQQHHPHQPYMPKQHNFFINNIIKTELMDADDVDDIDNDILAVAQQNNEKLSNLQQQLESNLDLAQFAASVAPSSGIGGGGGGATGPGGIGAGGGGGLANLSQNLLFPNVAHQIDLDDIDDDDDDDDGEDDDEIDCKTNVHHNLKKIASKLFQNPYTMKNNNSSNDNNCAINMTNNNNNNINNQHAIVTTKKETKDELISVAIEERRKKIELLETQINYWKTLTSKIETCEKICCCKIESFHNRNSNNINTSNNTNTINTSSNNIIATPIINNLENN